MPERMTGGPSPKPGVSDLLEDFSYRPPDTLPQPTSGSEKAREELEDKPKPTESNRGPTKRSLRGLGGRALGALTGRKPPESPSVPEAEDPWESLNLPTPPHVPQGEADDPWAGLETGEPAAPPLGEQTGAHPPVEDPFKDL